MAATREYDITLSEDASKSEVIFPHFPYDAYSGTGLPNPWSITKCFEACRAMSIYIGFMSGYQLAAEGNTFVLMNTDYTFNWDMLSGTQRRRTFPFKIVMTLKRVGKSSAVWHHEMVNLLDNTTLAYLDAHVVHLNRQLRKSQPFPEWFISKYARFQKNEVQRPRFLIPEVPPPPYCFTIPVTVNPSSIDTNDHLNNSEIVRFSLDCVAVASQRKHFKHIQNDTRKLWLLDMSIYYRREALMGEHLTVTTWEGETQGEVLCAIYRGNDVLTFHKLTFKIHKSSL